ncbi:FGLLP motif-containing membrane protein [Allosalinactinospora lopnorensis]|uniref:FGLLP motif-containing membrane protein n=1 Tax=Allosalinactinospora lopnorensis TaxID=1352348 RepID=UPI000623E794|nr:FGLLP motif-containing membrane protein [Allosalinactinospora lopnorensis]
MPTPDAEGITTHEHMFWDASSGYVNTIVLRDAEPCALPEGSEGPDAEAGRGVRVSATPMEGDAGPPVDVTNLSVFYADPDDLVIEVRDLANLALGDVALDVECQADNDEWVPVGGGVFTVEATDNLPPGTDFPTTEDFGPVVEGGRIPLSLAALNAEGPVGYPISELDLADVRAELDGERLEIEGTAEDARVILPADAEPGLHMLSLAYDDPALWWVVVPVINGFAAPEPDVVAGGDGVPRLEELRTDPTTLLAALGLTAAAIVTVWLLVGFPSDIFNKSLEGNRGRVRNWWQRIRALLTGRGRGERRAFLSLSAGAAFLVFWVLSAALPVLLNRDPAPEATPWLDFLGLLVAVFAVTVVYAWVVNARDWAWSHVPGRFEVLPAGLVIIAFCSLASAAADFEPGYFYGLIAGFAAVADRRSRLAMAEADKDAFVRDNEGRATRLGAISVLALSILCYLLWNSVDTVVQQGEAPFGVQLLDKALFSTALLGIQTVVFGLLPMQFLDGHRLWTWGRRHWHWPTSPDCSPSSTCCTCTPTGPRARPSPSPCWPPPLSSSASVCCRWRSGCSSYGAPAATRAAGGARRRRSASRPRSARPRPVPSKQRRAPPAPPPAPTRRLRSPIHRTRGRPPPPRNPRRRRNNLPGRHKGRPFRRLSRRGLRPLSPRTGRTRARPSHRHLPPLPGRTPMPEAPGRPPARRRRRKQRHSRTAANSHRESTPGRTTPPGPARTAPPRPFPGPGRRRDRRPDRRTRPLPSGSRRKGSCQRRNRGADRHSSHHALRSPHTMSA